MALRATQKGKAQLTREESLFLSKLRERKKEKKKKKQWKNDRARKARRAELDEAFGKRSKIIQMLAGAYASDDTRDTYSTEPRPYRRHLDGRIDVVVPTVFSIIEAPEKTMATVEGFAKNVRQRRVRDVHLNHTALKRYDLAANGLLDLVAVELNKEASRTGRRVRWRGAFPKDANVQRFIRALGIIKHLGLARFSPAENESAALRVFDERRRHYYRHGTPTKADYKTKVVAAFADHINQCLQDHNRRLTPEARSKLCDYTGEIIDNAEEHAVMLDWTVEGYLDNSLDTPLCEIAIFNFGNTIAQTMQALPRDGYTWKQIQPYMNHYKAASWFGPGWSEEDLLTLIALQGHVSSKNQSPTDTRGNGTIDLIEFFQKVYSECAKESAIKAEMAILSGGTHIRFDGTYKLSQDRARPKVIAFNAENDLTKKPDHNYVKGVKGVRFPGTIISIKFPLSSTSTVVATKPDA